MQQRDAKNTPQGTRVCFICFGLSFQLFESIFLVLSESDSPDRKSGKPSPPFVLPSTPRSANTLRVFFYSVKLFISHCEALIKQKRV